jgi:uncharacterized membrane protein
MQLIGSSHAIDRIASLGTAVVGFLVVVVMMMILRKKYELKLCIGSVPPYTIQFVPSYGSIVAVVVVVVVAAAAAAAAAAAVHVDIGVNVSDASKLSSRHRERNSSDW